MGNILHLSEQYNPFEALWGVVHANNMEPLNSWNMHPSWGKGVFWGHVSSMGISLLCYPKYNEKLMKNISRGKFLLARVCSEQSYQCRFLDRRVYGSDLNIFLMDHSALKMWSTTIHVSTIYSDITIRKSTLQICHEKSSHTICPSQAILTAFIQISMTFKILLFNLHFK